MPKKAASKRRLNRQERLDLDIEIGFLEGAVHRDPTYVDALQILGDDYTKRGHFTQGLKIDEILAGGAAEYVDEVRSQCAQIHAAIHQVYFDYLVESAMVS